MEIVPEESSPPPQDCRNSALRIKAKHENQGAKFFTTKSPVARCRFNRISPLLNYKRKAGVVAQRPTRTGDRYGINHASWSPRDYGRANTATSSTLGTTSTTTDKCTHIDKHDHAKHRAPVARPRREPYDQEEGKSEEDPFRCDWRVGMIEIPPIGIPPAK